jgi:hypothetical protein
MTNSPVTIVQFRKFKDGQVIAIFPEMQSSPEGYQCGSYMHIGQHGGCDPIDLKFITTPATEAEYAPLKQELERIGYRLRVVERISHTHYWWTK